MQVWTVDLEEPILRDEGVKLIILGDHYVVYHALELSVDQEQEAGVESGVPIHTTPLIYFNLTIIVNVSDSTSDSIVLRYRAIRHLHLGRVLHIEGAPLIRIVSDKIAIFEQCVHSLIVSEYNRSPPSRVILNKFAITRPHHRIRSQLNERIGPRKVRREVRIGHEKVQGVLLV